MEAAFGQTLIVLIFFLLSQCSKHNLISVSLHIIVFQGLFSEIGLKIIIPLYIQGKYLLKAFHNCVMNFTDFLEISHLS